jgi:hypothetical protein
MDHAEALSAALDQIDRAFGRSATGEAQPLPGTMTERVARVLYWNDPTQLSGTPFEEIAQPDYDRYVQLARDIFVAMGRPTDGMLNDAEGWQPKDSYQDLETERERIEFLWQVMLECAEAELSEETLARKARGAEFAKLSPEDQAATWAKWEAEHQPPRF